MKKATKVIKDLMLCLRAKLLEPKIVRITWCKQCTTFHYYKDQKKDLEALKAYLSEVRK